MADFGIMPMFRPWFDEFFGHHQPGISDPFSPYWPNLGSCAHAGQTRASHEMSCGAEGQGQFAGPSRPTFDRLRSGLSRVTNDKNEFKITLDVLQFKPEEITVRTSDKYVTVEGSHEEREDEHNAEGSEEGASFVQRHFLRRYLLPAGVRPEDVRCTLSPHGVLAVTAPKTAVIEGGDGGGGQQREEQRVVPVIHSQHRQQHQQGAINGNGGKEGDEQ